MNLIQFGKWNSPSFMREEAFRTLKTNLQFCGDDIKAVLLSSVAPNEGKSKVTMSLAYSIAKSGKKVLVIDTDLRHSVLEKYYQITSVDGKDIFGLSYLLSGQKKYEEVICQWKENPLFHIIPAGPPVPNPSEMLEHSYFVELMKRVREEYDVILLDTTPLSIFIDAAVVARQCDGAVLIAVQGETKKEMLLKAKNQLLVSGVRVLGVVMNKVEVKKRSYYGKYYKDYAVEK